jgi:hypothetical protein
MHPGRYVGVMMPTQSRSRGRYRSRYRCQQEGGEVDDEGTWAGGRGIGRHLSSLRGCKLEKGFRKGDGPTHTASR